ncbi:MAG: alpha/beta hydrolase [Caulobacterales bacterium]|nr:alpha/beta hydrolase [Caulobacterales bacterium]MCA0372383.1 alpha/beta hydrolase [Pseudomonadota bacterium]
MKIIVIIFTALSTFIFNNIANAETFSAKPIVIGQSYEFLSKEENKKRQINVLLPPFYDEDIKKGTKYDVLYVLDGGINMQDFVHIAGMVHQGNQWNIHKPLIVVGIESLDRKAELTYMSSVEDERKQFPTSGQSQKFRDILVKEIKPFIENTYATSGNDAIIGESLAALFITETYLKTPEAFDNYIAISPSLWWDNQSLSNNSNSYLLNPKNNNQKIWLSIANEGGSMQSAIDTLVKTLKRNNKNFIYKPYKSESHGTIYHPAATQAIRDIFKIE